MGLVTTSVAFTGFGFRDIGVGGTITESGSTAITHRDKFLLRLNFGPDIRGNVRPNLRTGSTSHGRHVLFLEQIKIQLLRKNLKALSDSATQYYRSQIFFWTGNKSNRRASLIQDPLLITSCELARRRGHDDTRRRSSAKALSTYPSEVGENKPLNTFSERNEKG